MTGSSRRPPVGLYQGTSVAGRDGCWINCMQQTPSKPLMGRRVDPESTPEASLLRRRRKGHLLSMTTCSSATMMSGPGGATNACASCNAAATAGEAIAV